MDECQGFSSGGRILALHTQGPRFDPQYSIKLGMVGPASHSSTWEVKGGGSEIQGHLELHRVFQYLNY